MPRFPTRSNRGLPSLRDVGLVAMPRIWPTGRASSAPTASVSAPAAALDAWTPLGPGNIGGRTRVLVIDRTNPDVMIAAGVSGGIWKSEDAGASWRPVDGNMANLAVNSMAMSSTRSNVLYAGTGEGYFREIVRGTGLPLRGGGIYRTADGGETWSFLASTGGADFHWVNDLAFSPANDRRLYAATRTGVFRSQNAGDSWTNILSTTVMGGCLDLAIRTDRSDDVLFASCGTFEQATVYRALDAGGGATFVEAPGQRHRARHRCVRVRRLAGHPGW